MPWNIQGIVLQRDIKGEPKRVKGSLDGLCIFPTCATLCGTLLGPEIVRCGTHLHDWPMAWNIRGIVLQRDIMGESKRVKGSLDGLCIFPTCATLCDTLPGPEIVRSGTHLQDWPMAWNIRGIILQRDIKGGPKSSQGSLDGLCIFPTCATLCDTLPGPEIVRSGTHLHDWPMAWNIRGIILPRDIYGGPKRRDVPVEGVWLPLTGSLSWVAAPNQLRRSQAPALTSPPVALSPEPSAVYQAVTSPDRPQVPLPVPQTSPSEQPLISNLISYRFCRFLKQNVLGN